MAVEQYANLASTNLTAGYTAGSGSITVTSTAGNFPASPQFRVYVADPSTGTVKVILKVTAITDATHFAVTAEGSDANATTGDVVKLSLTAGAMDQIRADLHQTGSLASAASQKAGNLYLSNNALAMLRDSGSAMVPWGPIWPLSDPTLQSWTQTHFGSCTSDTTHGGIDIYNPTSEVAFAGGAGGIHSLLKNAPSTPYHCEFGYLALGADSSNWMVGPCFSDGTKFEIFSPNFQGTLGRMVEFYATDANTISTTLVNTTGGYSLWGTMFWVRLGDDGTTNKTIEVSIDGFQWVNVGTEGRTTNFTATKVGIYVNGGPQQIRLLHYKETA